MTIDPTRIVDCLRAVLDPELGMSVVDLGLLDEIEIDAGHVRVAMTLTSPGCPLHDAMVGWVRGAIGRIPGVESVEVAVRSDPPWTPDRVGRPTPL